MSLSGLRRFRDLGLLWKLLLPFLVLLLIVSAAGTVLVVRDLSRRAEAAIDRDLFAKAVDVQASFRDRELYLLDSVRLAANLEGMGSAVRAGSRAEVLDLVRSVLGLREEVSLFVVTDSRGMGLIELRRGVEAAGRDAPWGSNEFVSKTLRAVGQADDKNTGLLVLGGRTIFATAGPIRLNGVTVGAVIAGLPLEGVVAAAATRAQSILQVFGTHGRLLASAGTNTRVKHIAGAGTPQRVMERLGNREVATLYTPLEIHATIMGTLSVSIPSKPVLAPVRQTALRLAGILFAAIAVIVGVGALLSRRILAQVRPLVRMNRSLGQGDLSARVPVLGKDELGELASGFNQMAEQLQASYVELESRVAQRTEELRRLYEDASKSADERARFFAAMSHEFRTPLFAILGHADMMMDEDFAPRGRNWKKEFGATIREAGDHLLTVVNEILDMAKFEAGSMEVELTDLSLKDVIGDISSTIAVLAERAGLAVGIEIPEDLPRIRANALRLKEIVLNLASNAIKYTPAPGTIGIRATSDGSRVEISVTDTGIGIPHDVGDRIFEPFYQVRGSKPQGGQASSGLGLALTKRLVEAHGGDIHFESRSDVGTTFVVRLHVADTKAAPGKKAPRSGRSSVRSPSGRARALRR